MTTNTDTARRDALLRLLADWEAGRMTLLSALETRGLGTLEELMAFKLLAVNADGYCLTPAGLAAARVVKGEAE